MLAAALLCLLVRVHPLLCFGRECSIPSRRNKCCHAVHTELQTWVLASLEWGHHRCGYKRSTYRELGMSGIYQGGPHRSKSAIRSPRLSKYVPCSRASICHIAWVSHQSSLKNASGRPIGHGPSCIRAMATGLWTSDSGT